MLSSSFFISQKPHKALLTGANRGLGSAICKQLESCGVEVWKPSRSELDLSSPEAIVKFAANSNFQNVDILINNAGINFPVNIEKLDYSVWTSTIMVNLSSAMLLSQAFVRAHKGDWGRILNVSSVLSHISKPGRIAYSTSKSGIDGMTRALATEVGSRGILVNAICPGYIDSELTRQNNSEAAIAKIIETIPLQRMAKLEEIANFATYLVSEANTYIHGQAIVIDGGFSIQ